MVSKSKPTNNEAKSFLPSLAASSIGPFLRRKNALIVSLGLILMPVAIFGSGCPPFGGAIDYFPTMVARVENHTTSNLIVYLDGEPVGITFPYGTPLDVQGIAQGSHMLDAKDGKFKTVYSCVVKKGSTADNVITIPGDSTTALGNAIQYRGGTYIDNPSAEQAIIMVNVSPFQLLSEHRWKYVEFVDPAKDNADSTYLVEAWNYQEELKYSFTLNAAQVDVQEMHFIPLTPYSLSMTNITPHQLKLFINKEYIGDLSPYADLDVSSIAVPPQIEWQNYAREYYYFEAKDVNGTVLYSQDFQWWDIIFKYRAISIPFSIDPKLIVYNNTTRALHVEARNKYPEIIRNSLVVQPREIGYYSSREFAAGFHVTIRDANGNKAYSKSQSISVGNDIKIRIP